MRALHGLLLGLVLAVLAGPSAWAQVAPLQPVVEVPRFDGDAAREHQALTPLMTWLEDPTQALRWDQALRAGTWRPTTGPVLRFGVSRSAFWLRLSLHNASAIERELAVDFGLARQDYLHWHVIDDTGTQLASGRLGDRLPVSVRDLPLRRLAIPVDMPAQSTLTLLVRVSSHEGWNQLMSPRLLSRKLLLVQTQRADFYNGLLLGCALYMLVLAVLAGHVNRDPSAWLYAAFLLNGTLYVVIENAFDLMYGWPNSPEWHKQAVAYTGSLASISYAWFVYVFLSARQHLGPWVRTLFVALSMLSLLGAVPALFGRTTWVVYAGSASALFTLVAWITAALLWRKGAPNAREVTLAFSFQLVALGLFYTRLLGGLTTDAFDQSVLHLGGLLHFVGLGAVIWRHQMRLRAQRAAVEQEAQQARARLATLEQRDQRIDRATGLPNRLAYQEWLAERLQDPRPLAIVHLDIARFKTLSEPLGQQGGNELARAIAQRCETVMLPGDQLVRVFDDAFALALNGVYATQAETLANTLMARLTQPVEIGAQRLLLQPRMGIATFPGDGRTVDELLRHVAVAQQEAARTPRHIQVFRDGSDEVHRRRQQLIDALPTALAQGQLRLVYQPVLGLPSHRVHHVEALLRWAHPSLGEVSPDEFFPLAEDLERSDPLTDWVLEQAIAQLAIWNAAGMGLSVSVNLCTRDLHRRELPAQLRQTLLRHGVTPAQLRLELSEHQLLQDLQAVRRVLDGFRDIGLAMGLDQFGAGHSSLARLKQLTVDYLKIDRGFITPLSGAHPETAAPRDVAIVRGAIALGQGLGLNVTAIGVEDAAVVGWLVQQGCDGAQGLCLCPPLDAEALTRWLADRGDGAP